MKRFLSVISIALLTITLFSCNKNEWTKENEAEFKVGFKESMQSAGKGVLSDEQINYITDCTVEKLKAKGMQMDDVAKPENTEVLKQMGKECAEEWMSKNNSASTVGKGETSWNAQTEQKYKSMMKQMLINSGSKEDAATFISNCAIDKFKEQNLSPADLEKPENGDLARKTGVTCGEEWAKKK